MLCFYRLRFVVICWHLIKKRDLSIGVFTETRIQSRIDLWDICNESRWLCVCNYACFTCFILPTCTWLLFYAVPVMYILKWCSLANNVYNNNDDKIYYKSIGSKDGQDKELVYWAGCNPVPFYNLTIWFFVIFQFHLFMPLPTDGGTLCFWVVNQFVCPLTQSCDLIIFNGRISVKLVTNTRYESGKNGKSFQGQRSLVKVVWIPFMELCGYDMSLVTGGNLVKLVTNIEYGPHVRLTLAWNKKYGNLELSGNWIKNLSGRKRKCQGRTSDEQYCGDPYAARWKVCLKTFLLINKGKQVLISHEKSAGHIRYMKWLMNADPVGITLLAVSRDFHKATMKSECTASNLWHHLAVNVPVIHSELVCCSKMVQCHMLMRSADDWSDVFTYRHMFPNSRPPPLR